MTSCSTAQSPERFGSPLGNPDFKARLAAYTPAGLVPALIDGDVHVWETLAIMEYLDDRGAAISELESSDVVAEKHSVTMRMKPSMPRALAIRRLDASRYTSAVPVSGPVFHGNGIATG